MSSNGRGCVVVVVVFFFTEQKDAAEGWKRRILNCAVASGSRPTMAGGEQDGRQLAKPLKLNGWGAKAAVPERTKYRPVFIHVDDASRCPREPEPQGRLAELLKDIIVAKRGGSSAVAKSKTSPRLFNNTQ